MKNNCYVYYRDTDQDFSYVVLAKNPKSAHRKFVKYLKAQGLQSYHIEDFCMHEGELIN
jgi:hypothetical protein